MYTALQIAHFIIDYCSNNRRPVSNLELQKIMYFLQVLYMQENLEEELISDEFCAWPYGPVIPQIYSIYSGYGGGLIGNYYNCSDIAENVANFIRPLIKKLELKGPWALVDLTHKSDTPWAVTYKNGRGNGDTIPKSLIRSDKTKV